MAEKFSIAFLVAFNLFPVDRLHQTHEESKFEI